MVSKPTKTTQKSTSQLDDMVSKRRGFHFRSKPRKVPLRLLLPNIITIAGLIAGLTAIRFAIEGRHEPAIMLIILAAFFDAVDGRVARALNASSRFGAELDSLADFVNFGVAPAILLYQWGLSDLRGLGWVAALGFAVSGALRLARFNANDIAGDKVPNSWQSGFFEGVPAPAGAICVLIPLYLHLIGFELFKTTPILTVAHMGVMAALMVSMLPTISGKSWLRHVNSDYVLPFMFLGAILIGLLINYPAMTLLVLSCGYLISLPFGFQMSRRLQREAMAQGEEKSAVAESDEVGDGF